MRRERLELSLFSEADFESAASTISPPTHYGRSIKQLPFLLTIQSRQQDQTLEQFLHLAKDHVLKAR